jgi:DNA-binding CsgD family transcriptional regulator/tellurite resistance protein
VAQPTGLAGRADEQAALRGLLLSLGDGMSGALVLRGEPGIGKTALLAGLPAAAPGIAFAVVSGVESEAGFGFAGLYRLLVPYLGQLDRLPAPQRLALGTALGLVDGPPGTPFFIGLAALTVLAEAAQDRPLVCVIDDAQWLDPESLEVLAFVARRVYAERLGIIFGVREPPRLAMLEGIPELRLSGLSPAPAAELLVTLAAGRVDPHVAARIARQAAGNPLVLTEAGRELAAGRIPSGLLLNAPVPVGQRLEAHFRDRVLELPPDCRALLLLAAASPAPAVAWRAAALGGLEPEAALPAEAGQLVTMNPELRFRHPLIRAAVYASAEPADRRRAHQLLARATDASSHPDLRAWHLAEAALAPDEDVAAELERCAELARRRGGFLAEAEFLARAAELSPDPAGVAARTLAAARAAVDGGAPLRAEALLDAGAAAFGDPVARAQAQRLRQRVGYQSGRPFGEMPVALLGAARVLAPADRVLARRTLLEAVELAIVTGNLISGVTAAEVGRAALVLRADRDSNPGIDDLLLAGLATLAADGYVAAAPLLRRAVTAMAAPDAVGAAVPSWFIDGVYATHALWDDQARHDWLQRCERAARATGALHHLQQALTCLSIVEAQTGQLSSAEARGEDCRQLALAVGFSPEKAAVNANAELLAWRGLDTAAQLAADGGAAAAEYLRAGDIRRPGYRALMVVHLSRGRYLEAFQVATRMRADDRLDFDNEALPNLVEAGVRSGHRDAAAAALAELVPRATASGTSWALGLMTRSQALLEPGDPEPLYQQSVGHLEKTTVLTDLARAHLLYGEWLRRQKRRLDARGQLQHAHDLFTGMGAPAFAHRAGVELAATGARVPKRASGQPDDLTAQEARIARLAAGGATNQMIATELFISSHTVGYHLTKAFRKLGVTSRQQLPGVLGR